MSPVLLDVEHLTKHFTDGNGRRVAAVDDVSFGLAQGESLGLVGESGSGKTTLINCLLHLLPPDSGHIRYGGVDVVRAGRGELRRFRREVQLVFQDPYVSLNPRMSVEQLVSEGLVVHRIGNRSQRRDRVVRTLELVGLSAADLDRHPRSFSGGQRQRIAIARALALQPKVLVCDEPVASLDVSVQAQVVNLLEKLQDELGLAYIFIAHDLSVVRHISDRVGVMYLGKMVELGDEDQIYGRPTHPYTQALLSAVPVPDPTLRDVREQIVLTGDVPSPANPPSGCRFHTRCWKAQEICSTDDPALELRPDGRSEHLSACHFAEARAVV